MENLLSNAGQCEVETLSPKSESPLQKLRRIRKGLADRLSATDAAIKALEENPEIDRVLELIGKAG